MPAKLRFLLPLALLALWLLSGQRILDVLNPENKNQRHLESQIAEIRKLNPEADAFFAKLDDQRDSAALGATIRAAETQHGRDSALRAIAEQIRTSEEPAYYRLMRLAADIDRAPSQSDREAILYSHGTTLQNLLVDDSGTAADEYLTQLENAAADPALWPTIKDDPIGLLVAPHIKGDAELWQFYRDERDWLADILATAAPDDGSDIAGAAFLTNLIRIAKNNHPQVKSAVAEFGLVALPLYETYGPILKETNELGVPDSETLEIIFANQDQFGANPPSADSLVNLKKNRPAVWDAARYQTLVLRLDAAVPQLSELLVKQFPAADIAAFLFTNYEDEIPAAAAALAKFGDLGLYILNRYQADPRVRDLLTNPQVGPRAIPFLARFGDQGFEKLDDNIAWLDRYFDASGNPKKGHSWIEGIPIVGAPANVVQLWAKGHPVSWGELGWAGLDVMDGALLVASFGASAPVTVAKQTAKATGRQAVKQTTRQAAKRTVATSTTRGAARGAARESFLKSFARRSGRWAAPIAGGAELVFRVGRTTASRIGTTARQAASKLKTTWSTSPLRLRKWTYRGLLAVGLYFTITERTIPNLPAIAAGIGEQVGKIANSITAAAPAALASALREWLDIGTSAAATTAYTLTALVLAALAAFLFFRKPNRIRRLA